MVELDPDSSDKQAHSYEVLNFKIMTKGEKYFPLAIRIEITSEDDVQFYYRFQIPMEDFGRFMADNDLAISYEQFIPMMKKLLSDVIEKQDECHAVFTLDDDQGSAFFKFKHQSFSRNTTILQLEFKQLEDE